MKALLIGASDKNIISIMWPFLDFFQHPSSKIVLTIMTWGINQNIIDFYCPAHYEPDFPCLQLQLTQRLPVPQDPVSIIVPIVYDMATGLTQQADIPRQHSSSGAAALMVSNILKRFNELHPARQGKPCTPRRFTVQIQVHLLTPAILFSFQVNVRYLLLFMSWWPTSLCPPALVSRWFQFRASTWPLI